MHMWHQVLIGANNVLAQMWAEKPTVLLDLLVGVTLVQRLRLNLEYLAHTFDSVQVENYVFLAPYFPLFVNDDPDTQGRVENFLDRCVGTSQS